MVIAMNFSFGIFFYFHLQMQTADTTEDVAQHADAF